MERHQLRPSPGGPSEAEQEDAAAAVPAGPRGPLPRPWEMHVPFVFVQKSRQQALLQHFLCARLSQNLRGDS